MKTIKPYFKSISLRDWALMVMVMFGSFVIVGSLSTHILEATAYAQVESSPESESNETVELADELVETINTQALKTPSAKSYNYTLQVHYTSYLLVSDNPPPERV